MYPVGFSVYKINTCEKDFALMKEGGIDAVELSFCNASEDTGDICRFREYSENTGVRLWSCHLPFYPFDRIDVSAEDEEKRRFSVNTHKEIIRKAAHMGIDKFIIHPSIEPVEDRDRGRKLDCLKISLDELADFAWHQGADICVEDLPRTCLGNTGAEMRDILSANPLLKTCFDTNHLLRESNVDYISFVASRIVTLHVSDYDFINERHWLPGEGRTDWQALIKKLSDINYRGVWMYEVDLEAPDSIIRERDLTYRDFYENAKALFHGKTPPLRGIPNVK